MNTRAHACSQQDSDRSVKHDLWFVDDDLGLYAITDGIGEFGLEASQIALAAAAEHVAAAGDEDPEAVASDAIIAANRAVFEAGRQAGRVRQMACSMTLVLVDDDTLIIAHLGDTRAFLVRDGLVSLTRDDTLRAELVAQGRIGEERSWATPHQHVITRAVGMFAEAVPRITSMPMAQGDRLLLASNGAYRSPMGVRPLWSLLSGETSAIAMKNIVDSAMALGEKDDVTVVLIEVDGTLPDMREGLERLQSHPLFAGLPLPHLVRLRNLGRTIRLDSAAELMKKGDALATMYLVLDGSLQVRDGDRVSSFGAGSILGYSRLLWTAPVKGDVSTEGPVALLAISHEDFRLIARHRPWAGLRTLFEVTGYVSNHPDPL